MGVFPAGQMMLMTSLKATFFMLVRKAVKDAVLEVEEKEGRAFTMQTDHNIYLR